jgi:hypothetical protein
MTLKWKLVLLAMLTLVGVVVIESIRWYVAGIHSAWVVLNDESSDAAILAKDLEAFRIASAAQPSQLWRVYFRDQGARSEFVTVTPFADAEYRNALATGRILRIQNRSKAVEIDRKAFSGFSLQPPRSGIDDTQYIRVKAVKVRIREGPQAGVEGWTLPEVMQHEVAWP